MKPAQDSSAARRSHVVHSGVAALGSVQLTADQFAALRQRPGPGAGQSLPNNFLKHADEQTVAGLAAVLQAIDRFGLAETSFRDWGVVAAPAFLGRSTLVTALQRYADEGAWGVSPHFIPHRSHHAVSGTISQALKIHGPNFGTGGGPGGVVEAFVAASVLVNGDQLPGVWLVICAWEPELIPDHEGKPKTDSVCRAVAFALVAAGAGQTGMQLSVAPAQRDQRAGLTNGTSCASSPSLEMVQQALAQCETTALKLVWSLNDDVTVTLKLNEAESEQAQPAVGQRPLGRVWKIGQAGAGMENKR